MKRKIGYWTMLVILSLALLPHLVWAKYSIEETIVIATLQIDRTIPKLKITYSEEAVTENNVIVTITANEEIQEVEGWQRKEDKRTLIKEYEKNTEEEIVVKDLSGNETKETIMVKNIDKEAPIIQIQEIMNSNVDYPDYANQEQTINIIFKITDDRKISHNLEASDFKIQIEGKEIQPKQKTLVYEKDEENEKILKLTLKGIKEEGNLEIQIPKGKIKDEANHENEFLQEDTKIQIDNTKPQGSYSQNQKGEKRVEALITANEPIRKLEGWEIEEGKILKKVFNNNLSYTTIIQDLAGNSSEVEINVTGASQILLSYASHNSMVGWSYGYGNYDIAGIEAIRRNPIYKTESLAFSIAGEVEPDFLQAKAYVYTNWGEGSKAICTDTKRIYDYGWNPLEEWKYETEENRILLKGRSYFQLGGAGVNMMNHTDINGNGAITKELTKQYLFGISGLSLRLKREEEYSILYQIYIDF